MARADPTKVEFIDYPLSDSLLFGYGISGLATQTILFAGNNQGSPNLTNMEQAAVVPSGGIYEMAGLRCFSFFQALADTEYTVAYGTLPALAALVTSDSARAQDCYQMLGNNAQVTFSIASKPMFTVPWWWLPAGGGTCGFGINAGRFFAANGVPGREAAGRFVKPLYVSSLQVFKANVQFYAIARASKAGAFTGNGQGGALTADLSPCDFINQFDGIKIAQAYMCGAMTRDIS
jgi:hypothetical protein